MSEIRHQSVAPTQHEVYGGGDRIEPHRHDDHQLIYISAGVLATHTAQGAWVGSSARAVWIPAGIWHSHRVYGRSKLHVLGFPVAEEPLSTTTPRVLAVSRLLRELLIALTEDDLAAEQSRRMRAVIGDRLRVARVQPLTLLEPQDPRLARACAIVRSQLHTPVPLDELARKVCCSGRTLSRLFRTELGMTFPQWRTNERIFSAMIDLAEGAGVSETASRNGWATPSAFIDTFSKVMDVTPGEYRSAASTL